MRMLKMIIIDDERLIRNGLTDYLDWNALGIEIAAVCADGREGMQAIRDCRPDIVLTDIAMPVLDGVELLKEARSEGNGCQFIFISSYSEFRYAQEAVKYGAFDYLLKPLEPAALEECIRRCVAQLQSSPAVVPPYHWELAGELFAEALSGIQQAERSFENMIRRQPAYKASPVLCVGLLRDRSVPAALREQRLFCVLPPGCAVCWCADAGQAQALMSAAPFALWQTEAPQRGGLHLQLCRLLLSCWLQEHGACSGDPRGWEAQLFALAVEARDRGLSLTEASVLCHDALEQLLRRVQRAVPAEEKGCERLAELFQTLRGCAQVYALFEQTLQAGRTMLGFLDVKEHLTPYTRKALSIIEARYAQNISLGEVARMLGISKSHLSATFKADTGSSFSDYLFEYRMKAAKVLLETGKYKISEIGEMVGYPDMAQFSKRFKQYYLLTPRDMQKLM